MAWPAIAQGCRTVLSPACDSPSLRAGFSASEGFSPSGSFSRNRRKGGSSCKLDSPSLRRRCLPRPKLFSLYWSGGDEKMLLLRLASWTDGFHALQASGSVKRGGKESWRRVSVRRNRRLCSHIWASDGRRFGSKLRRSIGIAPAPSTADPRKSRTNPRCWDEGAGEGEERDGEADFSSVGELLAAQEQAIRVQAREETRLFFSGPPRGDMAEIEAFCRIYRNAEQLNSAVMTALRANTADGGDDRDAGEVAVLEGKIATGLAHLMTKIQEGRAEILLGGTTADGAASVGADALPPFAQLRKEVRGRCETLEAALAALFSAGRSAQFAPVRARLQKLKNVCLDAGFPRPETIPGHADIPNLAPVRLRASRGGARAVYADENIAFWRGGQVTEDGLAWLVEKRFKAIVDLREAASADEKVPAGKVLPLRVVRMPMERGSVPSDEQVAEFARLVADPGNQPLYLHTLAGVGRASAMVSRWREFVLREQLRLVKQEGRVSGSVVELPRGADDLVRISLEDAQALEAFETVPNGQTISSDDSIPAEENAAEVTKQLVPSSAAGDVELPFPGDGVEGTENEEGSVPSTTNGSAHGHTGSFHVTDNAFEAQRPSNVFSRKAMSKFMKHKKIPSIFLTSRINRHNGNFAAPSNIADSLVSANIAGPANRWGLANPGIPRGDGPRAARLQHPQPEPVATALETNGSTRLESTNGNNRPNWDESGGESDEEEEVGGGGDPSRAVNGSSKGAFVGETPGEMGSNSSSSSPSDEEDLLDGPCSVEGDMCASTTGVVRLQSRKKAEMFLVRTDGYSCVRERVKQSTLAFSHPSTQQQMLMWKTRPRTVMLLKKLGNELMKEAQEVASFLHHQEGMNVMVEPEVHDQLARIPGFGFVQTFHTQDANELHERVDFIVCLGGDGVILHASNLFRNAVPPVVSFNLGSLGFLTSHTFSGYREDLQEVIHGHNDMMTGVYITLRMRLRCELFRGGKAIPGKVFDVLNEVVVDRGSNPYLSKIECFERDRLITKVQADGVIVATPTGSTAYSIAAGGSMVHPNVPCMLFTPICPHSLSFRPLILPDSALLELKVPKDARNNAWVSFDGKRRQQLSKGDSVRITMSEHPLPTVNKSDQTDDWFQSLVRCLSWNERLEQRPLSGV